MLKFRLLFYIFFLFAISLNCYSVNEKNTTLNNKNKEVNIQKLKDSLNNKNIDIEVRKKIIQKIIEIDDPESAKIIYEAIKIEPELLIPNAISYWGEKAYRTAVPLIINILEGNTDLENVYYSIYTLAILENKELDKFIYYYYQKAVGEKKYKTLLAVYDSKNNNLYRIFYLVCEEILKNVKKYNEETLSLALDFVLSNKDKKLDLLPKEKENSENQENEISDNEENDKENEISKNNLDLGDKKKLKEKQKIFEKLNIPEYTNKPSKRNPPLKFPYSIYENNYNITEKVESVEDKDKDNDNNDLSSKKKDKNEILNIKKNKSNINKYQTKNNKKELERVILEIVTDPDSVDPKTLKWAVNYYNQKNNKDKNSYITNLAKNKKKINYKQKIEIALETRIGSQKAKYIISKINLNLKKYAYIKGPEYEFIKRSYKLYFKKIKFNNKNFQNYLNKGLNFSGSLTAILKNSFKEFSDEPHRAYNLANLFQISRSDAKLLLRLNIQ